MRSRYFLIILFVLVAVSVSTALMHEYFLYQERLSLIDQKVRDTATALLQTELAEVRSINFEKAENIISEELGESRIGKLFIIRNQKGDVLFESSGAKVLKASELPRDPQWIEVKNEEKYIRLLNLQLPRIPDRTLQVGVVLDKSFLKPSLVNINFLAFLVIIVVVGLTVAYLLTSILLRPISHLNLYVKQVTKELTPLGSVTTLPKELRKYISGNKKTSDEFASLVKIIDMLVETINRSYKVSRFWTFQMAHELKTPLTILKMELEKMNDVENLKTEVNKISNTVSSFLDWAEVENSAPSQNLHALRAAKEVSDLVERLNKTYSGRIKFNTVDDFYVFSNPVHFEQALTNLISNAAKYSSENSIVFVELHKDKIVIVDRGRGIPKDVIARMGEPFNRGIKNGEIIPGHGLGLAWASSVARIYDWQIGIESNGNGTRVELRF